MEHPTWDNLMPLLLENHSLQVLNRKVTMSLALIHPVKLDYHAHNYRPQVPRSCRPSHPCQQAIPIPESLHIKVDLILIGVFPSLKPLLRKQVRHFSLKGINSFVGKHVQGRAVKTVKGEDLSDVPDMTSKFFVEHQESPEIFDKTNIFMGAAQNVVAGTDTTSIALAAIFGNLLTHPAKLSALRQELRTSREAGKISSPITFNELLKLPYLQAVLKEAMRLNPSAALPTWRKVPAGSATKTRNFVPA